MKRSDFSNALNASPLKRIHFKTRCLAYKIYAKLENPDYLTAIHPALSQMNKTIECPLASASLNPFPKQSP